MGDISDEMPFCGSVLDPRLFVAAPRNVAYVVGIADAREMINKLRHMMTVVPEEVSNLPERMMDEAAVAPLILTDRHRNFARSASPYRPSD